jgi:hypothetical protein
MILKVRICHAARWMQIRMENIEALAPGRIEDFLCGSAGIDFTGQTRPERYAWIQTTLVEQQYFSLPRKQRGAVRALLSKVAGLSMPQVTRLIRQYRRNGELRFNRGTRRCFPVKYTEEDVELLIAVDRAHQRLSGPATRRILQREWQVFGQRQYARLAEISVAHLYNLRGSAAYRQRAAEFTHTAPSGIAIGERRRPDPQGAPGYLRVDTVHQGDWEGEKGVYHINAVDTVNAHLLPCRHGRLFRVGGRAVRPLAEGQARGGRRTARRARRGLGGVLCGAQIRRPFGHAAADGVQALPAGHLRRRASRTGIANARSRSTRCCNPSRRWWKWRRSTRRISI